MKKQICNYFLSELEEQAKEIGLKPYRARQVVQWIYKKGIFDWEKMSDLSKETQQVFEQHDFQLPSMKLIEEKESKRANKYLFQLEDGEMVESVLLIAQKRLTLCVSTQVGCPIACRFCASGLDGLKRNLEVHEIVEQVLRVNQTLKEGKRIDNIVVMGMGEPFLNYPNLMKALRIINAPWGCEIGARHITISTAGIIPGIKKFMHEKEQFCLAISFHAATDEKRSKLMPINQTYSLSALKEICKEYLAVKRRDITFEYLLIEGENDSLEDAQALIDYIGRLRIKINLIPYNPIPKSTYKKSSTQQQDLFFRYLADRKVVVTMREEKGSDIDGACGQLRLRRQFS